MQVNNPISNRFNDGIVRNDHKGKQALNKSAPTTDKVMDLTDKSTVQKEIATKDVNFIRIKEKQKDVFLDVTKMPREEKNKLIADLKNKVSGAAKYDNFDPEAFFKLSGDKAHFKFGEPVTSNKVNAVQVKNAQNVLDQSITGKNEAQKQIFEFMNGDETALNKADAKSQVGTQKKPAEWYNGFQVEKNEQGEYAVSTYQSDPDKAADKTKAQATPPYDLNTQGYANKKGIEAYQSMLKADFNFNGAVGQLRKQAYKEITTSPEAENYKKMSPEEQKNTREAKAEALFTESVVKKFSPKHPNLSDDQLKLLSKNVWSYATAGADAQGKIDIGEMQGMLKQLDPEMVKSGSNNANSGYGSFRIKGEDGTSISLPKGDPYHGRGTILQTRHLMESFKPEGPSVIGFKTPPPELQGYENTIILADHSASMGDDMQNLSKVIAAGGIEGNVSVGTFIDTDKPMEWSDEKGDKNNTQVKLSADEAETLLKEQGGLHGDNYGPQRSAIPNTKPGSAFAFEDGQSMKESGIRAGIKALKNQPSAPNTHANQLILFTDETDVSTAEDLKELQELAKDRGYDVKVVFTHDNGQKFNIIDVNNLSEGSLSRTGLNGGKNDPVKDALKWTPFVENTPKYNWSDTGI